MTQLRDARLQRALDAAPDAALRPAPRMRDAIRRAALEALPAAAALTHARPGRWRAWAASLAAAGAMPWNAAFATLLVAGFVTLLWHDPAARHEAAPAPAAPLPAPALSSSPAPARRADPAPLPAAPPATTRLAEPAEPMPAPQSAPARRSAAASQGQAAPRAEVAAAHDAAPPLPAAPALRSPVPAAARVARAPPAAVADTAGGGWADGWSRARVSSADGVREIGRVGRWADWIGQWLRAADDPAALGEPVGVSVELWRDARPLARIELGTTRLRVTPADGSPALSGPLDPVTLRAARAELAAEGDAR